MSTRRLLQSTLGFALTMLAGGLLAQDGDYQCRQGELIRRVTISYDTVGQPVPCRVVYSKPTEGGTDQVLWNAANETGYCEFKAKEFRAQLESWGWVCSSSGSSAETDAEQLGEAVAAPSAEPTGESE